MLDIWDHYLLRRFGESRAAERGPTPGLDASLGAVEKGLELATVEELKLAIDGLLRPGSWWVENGKAAFSSIVTGNPRKNISERGRIEQLMEDAARPTATPPLTNARGLVPTENSGDMERFRHWRPGMTGRAA